MFDVIKRPYKYCAPEETIATLRSVLEKNHIMPEVVHTANPYPGVYSMTVRLEDSKGGFETHGKGNTSLYAHASALAEFVERLQNGFFSQYSRIMQNEIYTKTGYYFYPDEKEITIYDVLNLPEHILEDIIPHSGQGRNTYLHAYFNRITENGKNGVIAVPYYDVLSDKIVYIPYNLLTLAIGSNGNAAGNTLVEAVFQGICEILERWAGAEIFHSLLTPPTIPREVVQLFENEYAAIQEIEKTGEFHVEVKDFSAGKNIPAVGVIIFNAAKNKYRLNIGCDTSFQIALGRSLSEIYQGIASSEEFKMTLLDVPTEVEQIFVETDVESQLQRELRYAQFCRDNSGQFPATLFSSTPSYTISTKAFTTYDTYDEEVRHLIDTLREIGHRIYIRDVSFLGFPSVSVYVPNITVKGKKSIPLLDNRTDFNITEHDRILKNYFRFQELTDAEIRDIADVLSRLSPDLPVEDVFETHFHIKSPFKGMPLCFLLTLLWYYLGEFEMAYKNFYFFWNKEINKTPYNNAVHEYLNLKKTVSDDVFIEMQMIKNHDRLVVDEVIHDMKEQKKIFRYLRFPKCPDCSNCDLKMECTTSEKIKISVDLLNEYKRRDLSQSNLSKLCVSYLIL